MTEGVNQGQRIGCTPIIIAAEMDQHAIVTMLLDAGADPNTSDVKGMSALYSTSIQLHRPHVEDMDGVDRTDHLQPVRVPIPMMDHSQLKTGKAGVVASWMRCNRQCYTAAVNRFVLRDVN